MPLDQNFPWFCSQSEEDVFMQSGLTCVFVAGEHGPLKIGWTKFPDRLADRVRYIVWTESKYRAQRVVKEAAMLLKGQHRGDYLFDVTLDIAEQAIGMVGGRLNIQIGSHVEMLQQVRRMIRGRAAMAIRDFELRGLPPASA